MAGTDLFIFEEEYKQLSTIISKLRGDSRARLVFLIDKNGQQIAADGDLQNIDTTSLASLSAGNVAATDGLAKLLGEQEFNILFHEGGKDNIHISIVGGKIILVVIFDQRSSLGLVRLRVKKATQELEKVFQAIEKKIQQEKEVVKKEFESPFSEITDEDIDKLFG
jgi:predicted regulator of Ras-like GTPase activity (Roadblock/LC7/MglB family)